MFMNGTVCDKFKRTNLLLVQFSSCQSVVVVRGGGKGTRGNGKLGKVSNSTNNAETPHKNGLPITSFSKILRLCHSSLATRTLTG